MGKQPIMGGEGEPMPCFWNTFPDTDLRGMDDTEMLAAAGEMAEKALEEGNRKVFASLLRASHCLSLHQAREFAGQGRA